MATADRRPTKFAPKGERLDGAEKEERGEARRGEAMKRKMKGRRRNTRLRDRRLLLRNDAL